LKIFNKSVPIGPLEDGRIILQNHISETDEVVLGYKDNVFSIEFVGLQCEEPRRIQYAYKLDGFDTDWVFTDSRHRIAHYTNLPHDTYQFKVKVANGDGYWSEPVGFDLIVKPPFWLTKWAMFIYLLAFAGLLYGVRQITSIRVRYEHSLELERLEREKLEEVNQMKLQFFTNISHELRTPLTLILSPLEQFIREQKVDRKYHQGFLRMHHNARRLMTMINQLLDIRKSESGLMELKVVQSDIIKFCKEILLSFQTVADQSDIELSFNCEIDRFLLWFDRQQMEKVFYNLLSNAMKFTPEGGRIEMCIAQTDEDSLQIQIQDTGHGIQTEDLPYIFDRFYQAKSHEASGFGKTGTGIGLSLAKSIIDQHGGTISVDSSVGRGATFTVKLRTTAYHFGESQKVNNYVGSEDALHYQRPIEPQGQPAQVQIQGNPSILIVEDNIDIRAYLRENFGNECTIREASNGEEGFASAKENPPDLIIADISMPKMDGIRMCAAIKSSLVTSHIPIILLTARTSLVYQLNGLETGADDYITKPFDLQLLKARAKNLIESRQKLRERFTKGFDFSPEELVISSLDEELLKTIKAVIEKHIDDSGFSVEQLATSVHMSRMQLYRKLKALTGKSPNQILRSVRMQRAAQLLENKQFNIADVTYMVGYNDLKSFRDQFRKEFGMSPSQFRSVEE
jgi:signal transduction histidine kinase/DNA-binding response OmpR family regulator